MKWIIDIENKPDQRILVLFNALEQKLEYYGQYKIKNQWIDFSVDDSDIFTTLDIIQEKLLSISKNMELRVKKYEDLQKSFAHIKTIEIVDESKTELNDAYGFE